MPDAEGEFETAGPAETGYEREADVSTEPVETEARRSPDEDGTESVPNRSFHTVTNGGGAVKCYTADSGRSGYRCTDAG